MTKILFMGRKQLSANLLRLLSSQNGIEIVGVLTDSHLQGSPTAAAGRPTIEFRSPPGAAPPPRPPPPRPPPPPAAAKELGLPLYTFDTALEAMKEGRLQYDLGLSVLYWRKLRDEFLTVPRLGTINFHPALLPEYKGTGGYNLAIMDELSEWGSTAHYVDASIDTGEIIEVDRFPIDSSVETAQSLECKTMQTLEPFAQRIIARAVEAQAKLPTTPNIGGRYVSRDEMEAMKQIHDGDDVEKKIRAFWFPPYDGAYVEIDGQKYTLINRQLLEEVAPKDSTSLFAGKANA